MRFASLDFILALLIAIKTTDASSPMMAITTTSSIKVNAAVCLFPAVDNMDELFFLNYILLYSIVN